MRGELPINSIQTRPQRFQWPVPGSQNDIGRTFDLTEIVNNGGLK